jgi:hypothetical protein
MLLLVFSCRQPENPLLGEWQETSRPIAEAESLTLEPDGTVHIRTREHTLLGSYSYPDPDHLQIEMLGLKGVTPPLEFSFEISDRRLTLTDARGNVSTYERVSLDRTAPQS